MALQPPPLSIARQVELALGRGFWGRWSAAIVSGWREVPYAIPTSWWRSRRDNARIPGAHPRSQHLYGLAVDFAVPNAGSGHETDPEALRLAEALRAQGFVVIIERDHVHVQTFPAGVLS